MKRDAKKIMAVMLVGAMTIIPLTAMAETISKPATEIKTDDSVKTVEQRFVENIATVESIIATNEGYEALVKTGDISYRLNLPKNLLVVNQGEAKLGNVEDIAKGNKIYYYTTKFTKVGKSNPAFLTPEFVITNPRDKSHYIGKFDDKFLNMEKDLALMMDEKTPIIPQNGTKIKLFPESIVGKDVLVVYSIATLSLPAKTNPELVILLNDEKGSVGDNGGHLVTDMIGFTATANSLGYTVTWNEAEKTAMATKDQEVIKVSLKNMAISVNGNNLDMGYKIETKEGRLYVDRVSCMKMFPQNNIK